jgi:glycosyltransferase involved in cell wall biosynthesis
MKKNKKNIIIAADIFPPDIGGPATYSFKMAQEFHERGYNVKVVFYGYKKNKTAFKSYRIPKKMPVFWRYLLYFLRLMSLINKDSVVFAQGVAASGYPAYLATRITKVKFILKIVGDYAWEKVRVEGKTSLSIDDWQMHKVYSKEKFFDRIALLLRIQKRVVLAADNIITPSVYLKNLVVGWGAEEDKISVIYNSFKNNGFRKISKEQAKKELNIDGCMLLSVARMVPWKNFDFLIDIFPNILIFNPDFKLILVGDGPMYDSLKKKAEEERFLDKIIFTGSLPKEKVALYYQASDIFLLPSGYEGLPHVVLEALDFELPVIISDVGGNPELVENELNGLLVPVGNKYAWVNAIKKVWKDPVFGEKISKNNVVTKLESFSFDKMFENTEKIIFK